MRFKRKGIVVLVIIALMSAMLMGCTNDSPSSNGVPQETSDSKFNDSAINDFEDQLVVAVGITSKNEEILRDTEIYHSMDFLAAYADIFGLENVPHWFTESTNDDLGFGGIMIWADAPLYNFQVHRLHHEFDEENHENDFIHVGQILYELDVLPAGVPIVLNNFFTVGGVLPWEGISFEDGYGNRRYFAIADDRRGEPGDPPYYLLEFENGGSWLTSALNNTPFPIELSDGEQWAAIIIVDFRPQN